MTAGGNLGTIERAAYRNSYSDGLIDIFAGLSLVWIGVVWVWLQDYAGLAGVLPAVFVSAFIASRKRFVEERVGYVKWAPPRRLAERRNLLVGLAAGVLLFGLGIGAFLLVRGGQAELFTAIGPAVLAWLMALMAVGGAVLLSSSRMLFYAAVLIVAGAVAAATDANPGWPLLAAGIAASAVGGVMLKRFIQRTPRLEADGQF